MRPWRGERKAVVGREQRSSEESLDQKERRRRKREQKRREKTVCSSTRRERQNPENLIEPSHRPSRALSEGKKRREEKADVD
ncbi:hypothetical protein EUGRSUZ_E01079 [Eucalyptus grandis]|uniref:Uncharacterized protein n=2 Tax=Eucalyptus grandis TaxID=71139 RepID=A0A059C2C9_EUCGR|nr:hypothetical protein EUGRSUZ_E01079 [Eucalyptus grandis]